MALRCLLLTTILAIAGAATPELLPFEKFVSKYGFEWKEGSEEWTRRKTIYSLELARVQKHNEGKYSWNEGINKFSAMTAEEKKHFTGRHKVLAETYKPQHASRFPGGKLSKNLSTLPKSVDWREKGVVSAVKDQGSCGSCWAFASTAVIESAVAINTGLLFDLSVEQMAMCAPNPDSCGGTGGCQGSTAELAFDFVASNKYGGLAQEYQLGYAKAAYKGTTQACELPAGAPVATITGFVLLPTNNYTVLMNAVATIGPIAVSVDATGWSSYTGGVYAKPLAESPDINHLVVLVGYGEENGIPYWLVRNSWSPSWGEKGYIKLSRTAEANADCAMDTTPQDGVACAGQTDPVLVCGNSGILYDSSYPLGATTV